ncbi:cysteine-rich secretory protein family domain-containing protein [Ditylenchus destructor]|uniref:Cysteine-rich secretory protein family domain-containing protein n=1 Tax=Ditylenchus destructor TaxID=166010 RepID=A0AAD4R9G1_9BILA|nr:cysteine-rich secretory protein family domain-containing protein [Ditylenchus destructor]
MRPELFEKIWKFSTAFSAIFVFATALSDNERASVLSAHNTLRSELAAGKALNSDDQPLPGGRNIYRLTVDIGLEAIAQNWADGCQFTHSTSQQRNYSGENLYYTTAQLANSKVLRDASNSWWKELNDYGFSTDLVLTLNEFNKGIGHWSQMAWGRTTHIGCGVKYCPGLFTLVVCNYLPAYD